MPPQQTSAFLREAEKSIYITPNAKYGMRLLREVDHAQKEKKKVEGYGESRNLIGYTFCPAGWPL